MKNVLEVLLVNIVAVSVFFPLSKIILISIGDVFMPPNTSSPEPIPLKLKVYPVLKLHSERGGSLSRLRLAPERRQNAPIHFPVYTRLIVVLESLIGHNRESA